MNFKKLVLPLCAYILVSSCASISTEVPTGAASSSTAASPTPTATVQICPTSGCTSSQNDPNKKVENIAPEPKKENKVQTCPVGGCTSNQNDPNQNNR